MFNTPVQSRNGRGLSCSEPSRALGTLQANAISVPQALKIHGCSTGKISPRSLSDSSCSILSESDSTLGYEQVFSPLEYRSDAASAAECAGLRAERPCLPVYR